MTNSSMSKLLPACLKIAAAASTFAVVACEQPRAPVAPDDLLSIRIVSPVHGDSVHQATLIQTSVQHTRPVVKVEFSVDTVLLGVATASPYEYLWGTGFFADGSSHVLKARVVDEKGSEAISPPVEVTVDTTATALHFANPRNGWTIYGPTTLSLEPSDLARVRQVSFFVDGQQLASTDVPPFTLAWSAGYWADGKVHALSAVALDSSGKTGRSETIHVVVSASAAISPLLVGPVGGTYVGTTPVTLTWNALPEAASYEVEVSELPGEPATILSSADTSVEWDPPPASLFSWRVLAVNPLGRRSGWSAAGEFATAKTFELLIAPNYGGLVHSVLEASAGGYVAVGQAFGPDEVRVARLSESGTILWEQAMPMYQGRAIESSDGSFVVVGVTQANDASAVKLAADGSVMWSKTFTPYVAQGFTCGAALQDGSIIAAGYVIPQQDPPTMGDPMQGWLARLSASGDTLSTQIIRRAGDLMITSVGIQPDGAVALAGTFSANIDSFSFSPQISWLADLDAAGDTTWYREYTWDVRSMAISPASSYILGGSRQTSAGASISLAKMSTGGDDEWVKDYGGPGNHFASAVIARPSGGYAAAGGHYSDQSPQGSFLLSVDELGNEEWMHKRGSGNAFALSLCRTSDGGYLVGGTTTSSFSNRMWVYKTDRHGRVRYVD